MERILLILIPLLLTAFCSKESTNKVVCQVYEDGKHVSTKSYWESHDYGGYRTQAILNGSKRKTGITVQGVILKNCRSDYMTEVEIAEREVEPVDIWIRAMFFYCCFLFMLWLFLHNLDSPVARKFKIFSILPLYIIYSLCKKIAIEFPEYYREAQEKRKADKEAKIPFHVLYPDIKYYQKGDELGFRKKAKGSDEGVFIGLAHNALVTKKIVVKIGNDTIINNLDFSLVRENFSLRERRNVPQVDERYETFLKALREAEK